MTHSNLKTTLMLLAFSISGMAAADDYTDMIRAVTGAGSPKVEAAAAVPAKKVVSLSGIMKAMDGSSRPTLGGVIEAMEASSATYSHADVKKPFYRKGKTVYHNPTAFSSSLADLQRPVEGHVTSRFGYRPSFGRMHKGIDLKLNVGDTVISAYMGTVSRVAYEAGGYGNYVVVTHPDGLETRYGHLQKALVYTGQYVDAGDPIGLGGSTGNSTGPHLHFETRLYGEAIDPAEFLGYTAPKTSVKRKSFAGNSTQAQAAEVTAPVKASYGRRTYVVKAGDTPQSVAAKTGLSLMRLCQLNFIQTDEPLTPGRMLKLK